MVAKNSKVKLERNTVLRTAAVMMARGGSSPSSTSSSSTSSDSSAAKKRKRKRKRKRAKKKRAKRKPGQKVPTTMATVNTSRSPWIAKSGLERNQCSICRKFGHWRQGCPTRPRQNNEQPQEQMNINWICAVWNRDSKACDGRRCGALHICSDAKCRRHSDSHPASHHKHRRD